MIRVNPDKVRFCDPDAMSTDEPIVHTVDLSDDRSLRNFITLYCKGQDRGREWAARHKMPTHHDREIYHREEPWLPKQFPGMEGHGWQYHVHIDTGDNPPTLEDVMAFREWIPDCIIEEITEYFSSEDN